MRIILPFCIFTFIVLGFSQASNALILSAPPPVLLNKENIRASSDSGHLIFQGRSYAFLDQKTLSTQSWTERFKTYISDPWKRWWANETKFAYECVVAFDSSLIHDIYTLGSVPSGYQVAMCLTVNNLSVSTLIAPIGVFERIVKFQKNAETDFIGLKSSVLFLTEDDTIGPWLLQQPVSRVVAFAPIGRPLNYDSAMSNIGEYANILSFILTLKSGIPH
jgi:hypothetical protein